MTIRRATRRSPKTATPVETEDVRMKKARHLPMPGPGIVITVPLSLLPEYLELYQLRPMEPGEVRSLEQKSHNRKPAGVLWVNRIPKQTKAP
jgi:hypothetical protein